MVGLYSKEIALCVEEEIPMSDYVVLALIFVIGLLTERRLELTVSIERALIKLYKKRQDKKNRRTKK